MTTEEKIIEAAEAIFIRDGYDGARMQDIATSAGINKALLHYYFRSKENLFQKIFRAKLGTFLPKVGAILFTEISLIEKIEHLIEKYLDFLSKNPFLPIFIFQTVHRNPEFVVDLPKDVMLSLVDYFNMEIEKGSIRRVDPLQFIPSLIGMCIFPFLARPIVQHMLNLDDPSYQALLASREEELKKYVRSILAP